MGHVATPAGKGASGSRERRAERRGGSAGTGGNPESMSSLATNSLLAVGTGLDVGAERQGMRPKLGGPGEEASVAVQGKDDQRLNEGSAAGRTGP